MSLNLGCGKLWKRVYPDYDGVDILDYGQKYVGDIFEILKSFDKNSVDEVMANHFLEHFDQDDLKVIFNEVHRILVPDGLFKIQVPHMKKGRAWVLSHKTFWCEYTFEWFNRKDCNEV